MDTKKLRQKILDLAIRGKLVPQDPNDEPSIRIARTHPSRKRTIDKEWENQAQQEVCLFRYIPL